MHDNSDYRIRVLFQLPQSPQRRGENFILSVRRLCADDAIVRRGRVGNHDLFDACGVENPLMQWRQVVKTDRKSTRLNSSHVAISYAVFCLKKQTQALA